MDLPRSGLVEMTAGEHEMLNLNNKKVSSPF